MGVYIAVQVQGDKESECLTLQKNVKLSYKMFVANCIPASRVGVHIPVSSLSVGLTHMTKSKKA